MRVRLLLLEKDFIPEPVEVKVLLLGLYRDDRLDVELSKHFLSQPALRDLVVATESDRHYIAESFAQHQTTESGEAELTTDATVSLDRSEKGAVQAPAFC